MLKRLGWAANNWGKAGWHGAKGGFGGTAQATIAGGAIGAGWGAASDDTSILGGAMMGALGGFGIARYGIPAARVGLRASAGGAAGPGGFGAGVSMFGRKISRSVSNDFSAGLGAAKNADYAAMRDKAYDMAGRGRDAVMNADYKGMANKVMDGGKTAAGKARDAAVAAKDFIGGSTRAAADANTIKSTLNTGFQPTAKPQMGSAGRGYSGGVNLGTTPAPDPGVSTGLAQRAAIRRQMSKTQAHKRYMSYKNSPANVKSGVSGWNLSGGVVSGQSSWRNPLPQRESNPVLQASKNLLTQSPRTPSTMEAVRKSGLGY